jgi:hypothetical protein
MAINVNAFKIGGFNMKKNKKKSNLKLQIINTIIAFIGAEAVVGFMVITIIEKLFF